MFKPILLNDQLGGGHVAQRSIINRRSNETFLSVLESYHADSTEMLMESMTAIAYGTGSQDIVTEGLKDLTETGKRLFSKVIEKIKEVYDNIIMYIRSHTRSTKSFITKYKRELLKFDGEFDMELYRYSLSESIPNIDIIHQTVAEHNNTIKAIGSITKENLTDRLANESRQDRLERFRGEVLNQGPIDANDYADRLHEAFRNGMSYKVDETVTSNKVTLIVNKYDRYLKYADRVEKEKRNTIRLLNQIEKIYSNGISLTKNNQTISTDLRDISINDQRATLSEPTRSETDKQTVEKLIYYYSIKTDEIRDLMGVVLLALHAKSEAVKESIKQAEAIIKNATKVMLKGGQYNG